MADNPNKKCLEIVKVWLDSLIDLQNISDAEFNRIPFDLITNNELIKCLHYYEIDMQNFNKWRVRKYINNLFRITIDEIVIDPYKIIILEDVKNIVIMYKFTYTSLIAGESIECIIPYYISEAHTNYLRSNIIYPFICINRDAGDNTYPNCPRSTYNLHKDVLFKLIVSNNILLNDYQKHNIDNVPIIQNYITNIKTYFEQFKKSYLNEHLPSVLPRINNIVDFLVALTNYNIINYRKENIINYSPTNFNGDEWYERYNMNNNDNKMMDYSHTAIYPIPLKNKVSQTINNKPILLRLLDSTYKLPVISTDIYIDAKNSLIINNFTTKDKIIELINHKNINIIFLKINNIETLHNEISFIIEHWSKKSSESDDINIYLVFNQVDKIDSIKDIVQSLILPDDHQKDSREITGNFTDTDIYRDLLLQNINKLISSFIKFKLYDFQVIPVDLPIENKTKQEFNRDISLCSSNDPYKFNMLNIVNFNIISVKVFQIIKHKINLINTEKEKIFLSKLKESVPKSAEEILDKEQLDILLKLFSRDDIMISNELELKKNMIKNWGLVCNKYLKYGIVKDNPLKEIFLKKYFLYNGKAMLLHSSLSVFLERKLIKYKTKYIELKNQINKF